MDKAFAEIEAQSIIYKLATTGNESEASEKAAELVAKIYNEFEKDIQAILDKLDWAKNIRGSDGFLIDVRTVCEKYIPNKIDCN